MEKGCQKSKRLSYMAKFKCEVIRCAEEKGNHKAAVIFGVDVTSVQMWRKHKAAISGCVRHEGNSLHPRKDDFLKLKMQSSHFFERDTRLHCL
jgi:hypothetical protein